MPVFVRILDTMLARLHHIEMEYDKVAVKFTSTIGALARKATALITLIYWF